MGHTTFGGDEEAAQTGGEECAGFIGVPIGPVFAGGERCVNIPMDIVEGFVRADADADVAGVIGGIAVAADFAAEVDGDHPGDDGGLVVEVTADGFGEVFKEKRIDGDAGFAAGEADLGGRALIEEVPGDGGWWIGGGAASF